MSDETTISPDLALVLHRVNAWWSQPALPPRVIRSLIWGGRDLGAIATSLRPDRDDLSLTLVERDVARAMQSRRKFDDLWHQPLNGSTEDGWTFSASGAGVSNWSFTTGGVHERTETVNVTAWDWRMLAGQAKPVAWVTDLKWDPPDYFGNLQLDAGDGFSRGHYFLRGPECDYSLLTGGRKRWTLVVSERDGQLTHRALRRDLNALAFCFGAPLEVGRLCAVDRDLRVVGMLGGSLIHGGRRGTPEQSPTPSTNDFAALPVVLFETLTAHVAKHGEDSAARLTLATWYFLESLEERSADSSLVKMLLATIAASRYVLGDDNLSLARDGGAFEAWVTAQDAALAALERPDWPGGLRGAVHRSGEAEPETIVRTGAARAAVSIIPEIDEALHVGLGCLKGKEMPHGRLFDFLPRLRALASALVARSVNYHGRLSGWVRVEDRSWYGPPPDGWWECESEVAAVRYRATIASPIEDVADLWPDVPLPVIPETGPIALLRRHAAALLSKTDGRVYADVWPLPSEPDDATRRFEFVLRASRRPTAKAVLCIVSEDSEGVTVEAAEESVSLNSPADIVAFLRKLSESAQTRAAIERLLLASLEVERNAEG